ncbi:MAG: hypothetical protein ACRD24_01000, partial [Terriglobales bacterium]
DRRVSVDQKLETNGSPERSGIDLVSIGDKLAGLQAASISQHSLKSASESRCRRACKSGEI